MLHALLAADPAFLLGAVMLLGLVSWCLWGLWVTRRNRKPQD